MIFGWNNREIPNWKESNLICKDRLRLPFGQVYFEILFRTRFWKQMAFEQLQAGQDAGLAPAANFSISLECGIANKMLQQTGSELRILIVNFWRLDSLL